MSESEVRRWECPSSTGGKFWEVSRDGCSVAVKWGKLTAKGSGKSTVFETEEKAVKFVDTTIKKKEKEGYVLKTTKVGKKTEKPKTVEKKVKFEPKKIEKKKYENWRPKKWTEPAKGTEPEDPKYWTGVKPNLAKYFPKTFDRESISKYIAVNFTENQKWPEIEKLLKESPPEEGWDDISEDENEDDNEKPVPSSYVLPALYNTDAKGKERVYKIWVVKNKVTKMHGEVGGKQTLAERTYEGKNVGRINETDANEQACREAERDWVKQTDKLYKPKTAEGKALFKKVSAEKVKQGGVNTNTWIVLAKELRDVEIAPSKPKSAAAAKTAAAKEKKKANNGAMPGYKCDLFPMGCQKLAPPTKTPEELEDKVLKYLDFEAGVYVQRKLDGIRCLVRIVEDPKIEGKKWVVMMSRQGNQFVHLKSLRTEVLGFLKGHEDIILDCEVYTDQLFATVKYTNAKKVKFEEGQDPIPTTMLFKAISSTVRSSMTDPGVLEDQMNLYVFDIVDPTESLDQEERFKILDKLFKRKDIGKKYPRIIQVERFEIFSAEEITPLHDQFADEGYEGVVIRDKQLKYECLKKNKKSKWMRKYKYFLDHEYEIIGLRCDKGVPKEQFTWICQTISGVKFYPKPEGTREMKLEWFENKDDFLGKMLTVRYQGLEESGKPRFPIGVSIRDYE